MVTCCSLCMCLPGLCILDELYIKYQYVIFTYDPLSQKCVWLCLRLLTGATVLRAFRESASQVIILSLAQIKFPFFFLLNVIVNWFFVVQVKELITQRSRRKNAPGGRCPDCEVGGGSRLWFLSGIIGVMSNSPLLTLQSVLILSTGFKVSL